MRLELGRATGGLSLLRQCGARQGFHFGRFKIVRQNLATEFRLNTVERRHVPPKDTSPLSGESVNVKDRRSDAQSPATGPGSSDQENGRTQTEPSSVHLGQGTGRTVRGEDLGGVREKLAAVKNEKNVSQVRSRRGTLRLALERVGGRTFQDVVRIGGIRRLSKERQRARGKPVMMGCAPAAVMQNQTNTAFARAEQELVIGVKRFGQRRHP